MKYSIKSDVILVVEDVEIPVYSGLLMLNSDVFEKLLIHNFNEKNNGIISLPEEKKEEFIEFLEYINPKNTNPIMISNVYYLSVLANRYNVERLMKECTDFFVSKVIISGGNILCEYNHAMKHNLNRYKKKCWIYLEQNFKECVNNNLIVEAINNDTEKDEFIKKVCPKRENLEACLNNKVLRAIILDKHKKILPLVWKDICDLANQPGLAGKPPENINEIWGFISSAILLQKKEANLIYLKRKLDSLPDELCISIPNRNIPNYGNLREEITKKIKLYIRRTYEKYR